MKIILIQDVKKLGKKGEIIEINDGYARNYILPQKLGVEANNRNLNDLKLQKIKAGEGGKVFGSVSAREIAGAMKKQCDLEIDKKKIQLQEPIRSFGFHEVGIRLHPQVTGTLRVKVEEA